MLPTASALIEKLPRALRRHRLMTAWMKLTGEDPVQLVRIRGKAFAYADMSDGFLRLIVIDKHYDDDFFDLADDILAGGGTFLDVGANFGLLSFGLAWRHGSAIDFHLFEPNPQLVKIIERSIVTYPTMRCTLNPVAVADRVGELRFAVNEVQTGTSHIASEDEEGIKAEVITLDSYLTTKGLGRVDLLKLDIEGYELSALRGAGKALRTRQIRAVYFEYFEKYLIREGPPQGIIDFLREVGFVTCFCRPCDYAPFGGPTHGLAGTGIKLLPAGDLPRPAMTDLMAVPEESLIPLGART